jgi:hypothetical protein
MEYISQSDERVLIREILGSAESREKKKKTQILHLSVTGCPCPHREVWQSAEDPGILEGIFYKVQIFTEEAAKPNRLKLLQANS